MIRSLEAKGKSINDAINNALKQLGVDRDDVSVEVIKQPKSGFLGIGKQLAVVKVEYQTSPTERAKDFAEGLLVKFGTPCDIKVKEDLKNRNILMEISGDNLSTVIGRRGETLDALQYLTTIVANRGEDSHWRVMIDAQGYRSRREDSLESLAKKMAEKALKYKKPVALEPMPAHERRIIHSALQNTEGVSTYSTGTEPNRKVVILPEGATTKQPVQSGGKKNGNYHRRRRPSNKKPQGEAEKSKS